MAAISGTYVFIGTGGTWAGYEEKAGNSEWVQVDKNVTKAGNLSKATNHNLLPYWSRRHEKQDDGEWAVVLRVAVGTVARFDPKTEEQAQPIPQHIDELMAHLEHARKQLYALYEYQAGPQPPLEKVRF